MKVLGKGRAWLALPVLAAIGGFCGSAHAQTQAQAVSVVAGGYHTCAIMSAGNVKCWGYNAFGQLGYGDTVNRGAAAGQMGDALPAIFIPQNGPVKQLALGAYHTCALDAEGNAYCWGYNAYGQLGNGNTNNIGDNPNEVWGGMFPVTIETQKIVAGDYHTCALKYGGAVWCWGYNGYGQLGAGDTVNRTSAGVVVNLGTGRKALDIAAAGYSTCALLDNQTVKCWGYNGVGTLGLGDTVTRGNAAGQMGDALPAVDVGFGGFPLSGIVAGKYHVCATRANNAWPKCWGYNVFGQLGLNDTNNRGDNPGEMGTSLPFMPAGSVTWQMAAGYAHTCVSAWSGFTGRSRMKCFGYNGLGQLGQGDTVSRGGNPGDVAFGAPAAIDLGTDPDGLPVAVIGMTAGTYHSCALIGTGRIKCWGYNGYGQLGLGDTVNRGDQPGSMGAALPDVDL